LVRKTGVCSYRSSNSTIFCLNICLNFSVISGKWQPCDFEKRFEPLTPGGILNDAMGCWLLWRHRDPVDIKYLVNNLLLKDNVTIKARRTYFIQ
jgi:hypothetical protein